MLFLFSWLAILNEPQYCRSKPLLHTLYHWLSSDWWGRSFCSLFGGWFVRTLYLHMLSFFHPILSNKLYIDLIFFLFNFLTYLLKIERVKFRLRNLWQSMLSTLSRISSEGSRVVGLCISFKIWRNNEIEQNRDTWDQSLVNISEHESDVNQSLAVCILLNDHAKSQAWQFLLVSDAELILDRQCDGRVLWIYPYYHYVNNILVNICKGCIKVDRQCDAKVVWIHPYYHHVTTCL
jgi:hypothetical protein